jgi:N-acetylmuramoyl-L-alanine amidase
MHSFKLYFTAFTLILSLNLAFAQKASVLDGKVIVIDPGHGGEDFGAIGVGGLMEKDVVLDIALRLEKLLISKLQARVRLTRRNDVFVPLAERTNFANDFDAKLFVSLHINASPKGNASGLETYYLDNTDDAGSKKLAERENSSVQFEGEAGDLQFMLSDLIQNAKLDESIELANLVQRSLLRRSKPFIKELKDLGVRRGPFYVLVGAHMPCILAELFFIDHPMDGKKLADTKFRQMLAEGLFDGINEFLIRQSRPLSKKKVTSAKKKKGDKK